MIQTVTRNAAQHLEPVEEPYGLLPSPDSSWLDPWIVTLSVLGVLALAFGIGSILRGRRLRSRSSPALGPDPGSSPRVTGRSGRSGRTPAELAWDEFCEVVDSDRWEARSSEEILGRARVVLELGDEQLQDYRALAVVVDRTRFGPDEPGADEVRGILDRLPARRALQRTISRGREAST